MNHSPIYGMVTGNITVVEKGSLQLYGMCCGDLIVEQGGVAVVHGTVSGSVINRGEVELRGTVNGNVLSKTGTLKKALAAIVLGITEPSQVAHPK